MTDFLVRPLTDLPPDIAGLESESLQQGFTMVQRLRSRWIEGGNCFDQPGELFLGAFENGGLVGVGGLNRDPYADDDRVGRIRHVYVLQSARHQGVGRALVEPLVAHARVHFDLLRLLTGRAAEFYESLGFEPVDLPQVTHQLWLREI